MKRFYHKHRTDWLRHLAVILLFLAVFLAFLSGISYVSREASDTQMETLERAISRSITHCYATEGHYPESLDYLKEHYGISYDSDEFFVDYQAIGGNIFPEVTIIKR